MLHTPSSIGVRVLCISFCSPAPHQPWHRANRVWLMPSAAPRGCSVTIGRTLAQVRPSLRSIPTERSRQPDGGHGRWFQRNGDPRAVFAFAGVTDVPDWSVTYALTVARTGEACWESRDGRTRQAGRRSGPTPLSAQDPPRSPKPHADADDDGIAY